MSTENYKKTLKKLEKKKTALEYDLGLVIELIKMNKLLIKINRGSEKIN